MTDEQENNHSNGSNFDVVGKLIDTFDAVGSFGPVNPPTEARTSNGEQKKDILRRLSAFMSTERDAREYNMNHKYRGHAVIFNHETFDMPHLLERSGTQKDCESLVKTFEFLGFDVTVYHDLTHLEIRSEIRKFSEMDHTDNDCLVITILSHGTHDVIYSKNGMYSLEDMSSNFTANNCPSLAGKPKIFFIQACRGETFDSGIKLESRSEVDSVGKKAMVTIPVHADFLFAYSTVPGYFSFRNKDEGAWFIQALCAELLEHGFTESLTDILTIVLRKVSIYKESMTDTPTTSQKKQMPCFTSTLIRILRFTPKTSRQDEPITTDSVTT